EVTEWVMWRDSMERYGVGYCPWLPASRMPESFMEWQVHPAGGGSLAVAEGAWSSQPGWPLPQRRKPGVGFPAMRTQRGCNVQMPPFWRCSGTTGPLDWVKTNRPFSGVRQMSTNWYRLSPASNASCMSITPMVGARRV